MLLKGEMLQATFTIAFAVSGEPGAWTVTTTAPGAITKEGETREASPYGLLDEMLNAAFASCCRRYPERAPIVNAARRPAVRYGAMKR